MKTQNRLTKEQFKMSDLPESVNVALSVLKKCGYQGWMVGGCVRDSLMGIKPHDYDITTDALPEELEKIFSGYKLILAGMKHGTVTPVIKGEPIEITTFRIDGEYRDNRRPESVEFTASIADDLSRRDFTINAMAYSPDNGLKDLFGGREDLLSGVIRCVGEPDHRFSEDGLRILRAVRFASVLDFLIDPVTSQSIHINKNLLKNISAERKYSEFCKLICGKGAGRLTEEYSDVLTVFVPELIELDRDKTERNRTCKILDLLPPEPILRIACLFRTVGFEAAGESMRELKSDADSRRNVMNLLKIDPVQVFETPNRISVRSLIRQVGIENVSRLIVLYEAQAKIDNDSEQMQKIALFRQISCDIVRKGLCCSIAELAVNGSMLIQSGFSKGKILGDILEALLDAVIEERVPNTAEDLLKYAKEHYGRELKDSE